MFSYPVFYAVKLYKPNSINFLVNYQCFEDIIFYVVSLYCLELLVSVPIVTRIQMLLLILLSILFYKLN